MATALADPLGIEQDNQDPLGIDTAKNDPLGIDTTPTAPQATMSEYHPNFRQRLGDIAYQVRRSQPVETLLGRTPEEIAATPAAESAPTTHDTGVMGLFTSKKPLVEMYPNPKTALDGLHNWAASVVNSVASPGGLATLAVGGIPGAARTAATEGAAEGVIGDTGIAGEAALVNKALGIAFGAQGSKMGYDGAKELITKHKELNPAQTVGDIGTLLNSFLMTSGGVAALKGAKRPVTPVARPQAPARPGEPPAAQKPVQPQTAAPAAPLATIGDIYGKELDKLNLPSEKPLGEAVEPTPPPPPVQEVKVAPTEAGVSGEAIKEPLKPTDHVEYTPEDLAKYQELKAKSVPQSMEEFSSPEFQKNWHEFEALRNKYNGNPPANLPTTKSSEVSSKLVVPEPAPAQPAKVGEVKEPWQQTKSEYVVNRPDNSTGNEVAKSTAEIDVKKRGAGYYAVKVKDAWRNSAGKIAEPERWQVKRKLSESEKLQDHKEWIEAAVKAGKPVPAEVLADYPDLASPVKPETRGVETKGKGDQTITLGEDSLDSLLGGGKKKQVQHRAPITQTIGGIKVGDVITHSSGNYTAKVESLEGKNKGTLKVVSVKPEFAQHGMKVGQRSTAFDLDKNFTKPNPHQLLNQFNRRWRLKGLNHGQTKRFVNLVGVCKLVLTLKLKSLVW